MTDHWMDDPSPYLDRDAPRCRHGRMRSLLNRDDFYAMVLSAAGRRDPRAVGAPQLGEAGMAWPVPNVWLGVSVENQTWAQTRIHALLTTTAAVRWLSLEPLLGPVDLEQASGQLVDWVVVGGESGRGARPMQAGLWHSGRSHGGVLMALWFDLKVNHDRIGTVEIRRREALDIRDPAVIADVRSTYDVRVNGHLIGQVREHRYGDGAWRLLALATDLIDTAIGPQSARRSEALEAS